MNDNDFNELIMEYLRPKMRTVMWEYEAQLTRTDENATYEAIRIEYEKAVIAFKTGMYKQQNATLDTHKEGACLCCAIVKSQVLSKCEWGNQKDGPYINMYKFPNELFALSVAMSIVKNSLYCEYEHDFDMKRIIKDEVPVYPGNLIDKKGYLSNTIFYIRKFAEYGKGIAREYLFDSGAYSTILFHLDYENRLHISEKYKEFKATA